MIQNIWIIFFLLFHFVGISQPDVEVIINNYLNQIRHNPAQLRLFFQHMPKGGDLHHHYSGSIYGETYLESIEKDNLWVNIETFEIGKDPTVLQEKSNWFRISYLKENGSWNNIKEELLRIWSIKDYTTCSHLPKDQHFFKTFVNFAIPSNSHFVTGLNELKVRAQNENLQYIETMFTMVPFEEANSFSLDYNLVLQKLQSERSASIQDSLKALSAIYLLDPNFEKSILKHNSFVDSVHQGIDDNSFTMRYQNYVLRVIPPTAIFKSLLAAFASASTSELIVGVNIVAPENNTTSMNDYWLHMQMFKCCSKLFPKVKYAMHAGELILGLVKPEDLSWHIQAALEIAGAQRIGHGVDIMYETNALKILDYMKEHNIAIEINLTSNEFMLGIKGYEHPITIYEKKGVPIVISSDDAGGFRSDLTQQYVLLANRYTKMDYGVIKRYVFNGIEYSFLENEVKTTILKKLKLDFEVFENFVLKEILD